jgi:glycerol-3-phosphate dehydrogenase
MSLMRDFSLGFYDPGKIGYGLMHALMRDQPDLRAVAHIKPQHREAPPPGVLMTPTLTQLFQKKDFFQDDLGDFVNQSDLIFFCGRARHGFRAVATLTQTPAWKNQKTKKIINVSKGLWKNPEGSVNLPSAHFPDLYTAGRLGMLSGLSFHTTLLHDYPVRMTLSAVGSWMEEAKALHRPHRLMIETDIALRAAELYGVMKNPLAIAAGYFDGEDIPVLLGTLASLEADRVARTFYPQMTGAFSTCYALDDVWGSMTPLSRNFRYGQDLRRHGSQAADVYRTRENTQSLPEGVEGCVTWHLYRETCGHTLPPTPIMDAVYRLCQGHTEAHEAIRHAVEGYRVTGDR